MEPLSIFLSVKRGAMIDLIEARQGLEIALAELAAQRRTADDIEAMSQSILKMQHSQETPTQFYQDDLEFHQHVAAAAKNPVIEDLLEKIYILSIATRSEIHRFDRHFYAYIGFDISEHEKLFLSIKNRNPTQAAACMSRHMQSLKQRYLEMDT
jgi:GntR family transcriptional repressor for pyruvate dehydrogenase complex